MAIRAVERYFWILEVLVLLGCLGVGVEVMYQNSLRRECISHILLINQQAQEFWHCSPEELEKEYKEAIKMLDEKIGSLNGRLFWIDESKNEEGAGIEFMRRVKQVESRFRNTFPRSKFPDNLGFPTQMPSPEKVPYYNYYLNILERVLPIVLAEDSEIHGIIPVVDHTEGKYTISLEFTSDLAVLLNLFREVNSVPIINLESLEVRPEDDDHEKLSIKVTFSPFIRERFQVDDKNLIGEGTNDN